MPHERTRVVPELGVRGVVIVGLPDAVKIISVAGGGSQYDLSILHKSSAFLIRMVSSLALSCVCSIFPLVKPTRVFCICRVYDT